MVIWLKFFYKYRSINFLLWAMQDGWTVTVDEWELGFDKGNSPKESRLIMLQKKAGNFGEVLGLAVSGQNIGRYIISIFSV